MMPSSDLIGHIAGTCTTLAFLPQVWRVWRTRSVADISLAMYFVFVGGVALWIVYGIQQNSWPVIVANVATLLLSGAVLVMKLVFGRNAR